jgi:hypothetical protein
MQPGVNQMPTSPPTRRLTAQEAAATLGISVEAIRGRVKRGTLQSTKAEDGTVYVYLHEDDQTNGQTQPVGDQTQPEPEPVADQSELVQVLYAQLEAEREANRENRRIIAILASRVPELESAPEAPVPSQTPSENGGSSTEPDGDNGQHRRSWWRRLFEV